MSTTNTPSRIVAEFERPGDEVLRVETHEYKGQWYASARIYYQAEDGEWKPTKRGITLNTDILPDVVSALQEAGRLLSGEEES